MKYINKGEKKSRLLYISHDTKSKMIKYSFYIKVIIILINKNLDQNIKGQKF